MKQQYQSPTSEYVKLSIEGVIALSKTDEYSPQDPLVKRRERQQQEGDWEEWDEE